MPRPSTATTPPDVSRPFSFCDLGCGSGFTLNLLASLYPESRFVGVDIMAEHVAEAKRVAAVAGLGNVQFIEAGFADLSGHDLEPFDFITAHGVYTWVAPEIQRQLVDVLGQMLAADGLIYLGYNVMPGWAAMVPLRNLMIQVAEAAEGDLQTRVAKAADTIRRLRDGEAKYFRDYPVAGQIFDDTAKFGTRYLAHEYFGEHWQPVYFPADRDRHGRCRSRLCRLGRYLRQFRRLCPARGIPYPGGRSHRPHIAERASRIW